MVGDLVICNHYQDKPFTKQFGVADFAKGEYEFCEPIPLTEDILVKNGFTYEEDTFLPDTGYWSLSNEDGLLYFTINAFGVKGSGEVAFGYQDIALKYVHQLQNLLVFHVTLL